MNLSVEDIPHLKDGTVVAVDLETHDPDLKDQRIRGHSQVEVKFVVLH